MDQYSSPYRPAYVAHASAEERIAFLRKVYLHVGGAVGLFLVLETILQAMPFAERVAARMSGAWLLVILGFWVVGWISSRWTEPAPPLSQQYLGLGLFTVAEAIIFLPLIAYVLDHPRDEHNIAAVREKVNALTRRFPVYR